VSDERSRAPDASLWHETPFRRFWLGDALSQFGDRISELALPLIAVVLLDASAGEVGLLTAAVWGPNVVSLLSGAGSTSVMTSAGS